MFIQQTRQRKREVPPKDEIVDMVVDTVALMAKVMVGEARKEMISLEISLR